MKHVTISLFSTLAALAVFSPLAFAQEPTPTPAETAAPASTPAVAATATATPAPAIAKPAKKPAVPAPPVAPAVPGEPKDPKDPKDDPKNARIAADLAKNAVDEIAASVDYQIAQAKRIEGRGKIAAKSLGEITRSRERATDLVKLQLTRVQKAGAELESGKGTIEVFLEELIALQHVAGTSSETISEVRTYDDQTEESLQEIASCFEEIADKAESFVEEMTEEAHREGSSFDLSFGENGEVRFSAHDGDDRVEYGKPVEVMEGETVNDAVAIGESVTVLGRVRGSAVAIGGNVHVGKTGHVEGDCSAVGGRITVDDGGKIDGERVSLGPGAAGALLTQFAAHPAPPMPLGARIGMSLVTAAAEFLCFFLLGLLTIAIIPKRVDVVADGLSGHPFKSGAFGILAGFLFLPLTFLLAVIVIGIPLIPLLWFGYFLLSFVGYVAMALLVGRRFPTKLPLTGTATFAVGAGLIVAIGLIPILGKLVWFFAGFFALGAALMTRFGQDRGNGPAAAVPGAGLSSIA